MNLLHLVPILIGKDPREPLLGRAGLTALLGLALAFGLTLSTEQADALVTVALFVLPAASAMITALTTRGKVTPVTDPKSADGVALIRSET